MHRHTKFHQISQTGVEKSHLTIFKIAAVRHLGFLKISFFYQPVSSGGLICAVMQNFVEICQTVSGISRFLTCDAMLSVVYAVVVCLSVCVCMYVCYTLVLYIKTAKRRIMQMMPHDTPGILVF